MELESTKSLGSNPRSRHLPEDLLHEILRRLPVKSLLRFRCVSKPWLALVDDDADFARSHLHTFKNNRDQSRLFVEEIQRNCTVSVRCADTFESISEIPSIPYATERRGFIWWTIVSSLDGLVLLEFNGLLKLWNPSLRHSFLVPPLPPFCTTMTHNVIGLVYDPMAKDYKIVTVSQFDALPSVGIFTIGANSWELIQCSKPHFLHFKSSVCLQGRLYFIAAGTYKDQYPVSLWSFDLRTKVFSSINMPNDTDDRYRKNLKLVLVDGGSSVAMFHYYGNNSIWVLDRVTMNWRKVLLSGNLEDDRLLYGKKNGDMLILRFGIEKDVGLYRPEKNEYKILERNTRWCVHISTYVESLILNKLNRAPCMQRKKSTAEEKRV